MKDIARVCSYLMGSVAIRAEETVCQNLRRWQEGTGEETKGEKGEEEEKNHTDTMKWKISQVIKPHQIVLNNKIIIIFQMRLKSLYYPWKRISSVMKTANNIAKKLINLHLKILYIF